MKNYKSVKINKVVFIGSKKLGLESLKLIYGLAPDVLTSVITINDTQDTRSVYRDLKKYCQTKKIKFYTVLNKKDFNNVVTRLKPDFCVVCGWYWLIDNEILSLIPHGSVGMHGSLLPKYRGGSPLVWAMINGEKETGISLFSFAEGMDNGDIWVQRKITINTADYISDVLDKAEKVLTEILKENYHKILNHKIKPRKQDHRFATYCAQRIPEDGQIDWRKSSKDIFNLVRAQSQPYPGAFACLNWKKIIIWRAKLSNMHYYGTEGQVAKITSEGVYVICGDQKPIILETVQLEGSKEQLAQEVIKSIKVRFK